MTLPSIDRRSLQNFDWLLLSLMLLLLGIGLVNLFSATQAGTEGGLPAEFRRQLAALGLASIGMIAALLVDYRRIERLAIPFYLATLLLCASTLIFAPAGSGKPLLAPLGSAELSAGGARQGGAGDRAGEILPAQPGRRDPAAPGSPGARR